MCVLQFSSGYKADKQKQRTCEGSRHGEGNYRAEFDLCSLEAGKPVLVDFLAPAGTKARWASPSREVGQDFADRMDVYKCNVDDEDELAARFRIVSIPTLMLFKDGQPVHTVVGNMSKQALVAEIEPYL